MNRPPPDAELSEPEPATTQGAVAPVPCAARSCLVGDAGCEGEVTGSSVRPGDADAEPPLPPSRYDRTVLGAVSDVATHPRLPAVLAAASWCYPAALVAAPHVTWLVAGAVLGRWPVSSIDDPKSISPVVGVPYYGTGILLIVMPAAWLGGPCAIAWRDHARGGCSARTGARVLLYMALCAISILCLRWDPAGVMEWFFD